MSTLCISSKVFNAHLESSSFVLLECQFEISQMAQKFLGQAAECAPLCGMVLGQMAAPIIRFKAAALFDPLLGKTASHMLSWVCAMSTDGFLMAATPSLIQEKKIGAEVIGGTIHGTAMMMVCEGIAKRIPLGGGVLGAFGQDLGVVLVNWSCGKLTITEEVQGGVWSQLGEARIASMRISCGAGIVRACFVEVPRMKAQYELSHENQSGPPFQFRNFKQVKRFFSSLGPAREFATENALTVRESELCIENRLDKEAAGKKLIMMMSQEDFLQPQGKSIQKELSKEGETSDRAADRLTLEFNKALNEMGFRIPKNIAGSSDPLEQLAAQDPYRYEAAMAVLTEKRMPGMNKHWEDLIKLFRPTQFSEENLEEVKNRLDQIKRLDADMRAAYQARRTPLTTLGKAKYLVPNGLTATNMLAGFASIYFAFTGKLDYAMACGVGAALGDKFDGTAARLLKARSEFGKRFDSFSDLMGFGGGGAAIIAGHFINLGRPILGAFAAAFHLTLAAWRLLEFDINAQTAENGVTHDWLKNKYEGDKYFKGRATTVAPFSIAAICAVAGHDPTLLFPLLLLDSTMMKVNLRYPKIPDSLVKVVVPAGITIGAGGAALAYHLSNRNILAVPTLMILGAYATVPFVQAALRTRNKKRGSLQTVSPEDNFEERV